MACNKIENIDAYFDKELNQEEHDNITEHLKACKECQEYLNDIRTLSSKLKSMQEIAPQKSFIDSIMENIESQAKPKFSDILNYLKILFKTIFASPVVYACLLIAISIYILNDLNPSEAKTIAIINNMKELKMAPDTKDKRPYYYAFDRRMAEFLEN